MSFWLRFLFAHSTETRKTSMCWPLQCGFVSPQTRKSRLCGLRILLIFFVYHMFIWSGRRVNKRIISTLKIRYARRYRSIRRFELLRVLIAVVEDEPQWCSRPIDEGSCCWRWTQWNGIAKIIVFVAVQQKPTWRLNKNSCVDGWRGLTMAWMSIPCIWRRPMANHNLHQKQWNVRTKWQNSIK